MKYIYTLLLAVMTTFAVSAQETIQVDITKLSQQELQVYQKMKQNVQAGQMTLDSLTPQKIDTYAQVGKAFGSAFKECWTTVSSDAEKFAQSDAGKWAMVLVSWKIMGNDAMALMSRTVRMLVGGCLLAVGVPFFIYIFRRNCTETPLLVAKTKVGWFTVKKEYKGVNRPIHDGDGQWAYAFCFLVFVIMNVLIMFV